MDEGTWRAPQEDSGDSPNIALRSPSFRNYADYMLTEEFQQGMDRLINLSESSRTAYMCAERVYFHCHRMLVSDWLTAHGHEILHIDGVGSVRAHQLLEEARVDRWRTDLSRGSPLLGRNLYRKIAPGHSGRGGRSHYNCLCRRALRFPFPIPKIQSMPGAPCSSMFTQLRWRAANQFAFLSICRLQKSLR